MELEVDAIRKADALCEARVQVDDARIVDRVFAQQAGANLRSAGDRECGVRVGRRIQVLQLADAEVPDIGVYSRDRIRTIAGIGGVAVLDIIRWAGLRGE